MVQFDNTFKSAAKSGIFLLVIGIMIIFSGMGGKFGTILSAAKTPAPAAISLAPTAIPPGQILFQDNFNSYTSGQIITDESTYQFASFPNGGTSGPGNPSALWETDTGKFLSDNGWGFSGKPNEWADRYFFRPNTRKFDIGNVEIRWKYRSAPFGQDGFPVEGSDAVDLWLRYQTQYNLYTLQFDRTNNVVVVKRKVPAEGWTGPSNLISNRGVYYTLFTDSDQPIFSAGEQAVSWSMYSGEPNLVHDSITVYDMKARVMNKPNGTVQIQFWRNERLFGSWTDASNGTASDGVALSSHLALGYYNSVPGWNSTWGEPITKGGASGFRADNIKCWFDDFVIYDLSGGATPTSTVTPTVRPTIQVTPTVRATITPTQRSSPTPTRRVTVTPTVTPSPTPTRRVTVTPTVTPTRRPGTSTPTSRQVSTLTPTPTSRRSSTPAPTIVNGGYRVIYIIQSDWGNGATISIMIKNNTTTVVNGWTLAFTFPGNQTITNLWNGTYTQSGAGVSVKDAGHNASIPANGGSVEFGFNLNYSGTNAKPTAFTLNGTAVEV